MVIMTYHFAIGVVLINLLEKDFSLGLLFLPPLIMFSTIGNWSLHHTYLTQRPFLRFFLAVSTLLGAISSQVLSFSATTQALLLSFVVGFLLFVIVRESLPQRKEGKPTFFILGILGYILLIVLVRNGFV